MIRKVELHMNQLPKVLEREPLVDALFEVRVDGSAPLGDIVPGILFHKLSPKPALKRLPAAEFPQPVRANDPGLRYAPVQRLEWTDYVIAVGDRNVVISCKLPYPKWPKFKETIHFITGLLSEDVTGKVERFSVKYVNLIEAATRAEQIARIKLSIQIGSLNVQDDHVNMQVHHAEEGAIHILTVITGANGKMSDGRDAHGVVVDIDSIRNIKALAFSDFVAGLEPELETLRQANKVKFFDCLKPETIVELGPIYE